MATAEAPGWTVADAGADSVAESVAGGAGDEVEEGGAALWASIRR